MLLSIENPGRATLPHALGVNWLVSDQLMALGVCGIRTTGSLNRLFPATCAWASVSSAGITIPPGRLPSLTSRELQGAHMQLLGVPRAAIRSLKHNFNPFLTIFSLKSAIFGHSRVAWCAHNSPILMVATVLGSLHDCFQYMNGPFFHGSTWGAA